MVAAAVVAGLAALAVVELPGGDSKRAAPGKVGRVPLPEARSSKGRAALAVAAPTNTARAAVPARRISGGARPVGKRRAAQPRVGSPPVPPSVPPSQAPEPRSTPGAGTNAGPGSGTGPGNGTPPPAGGGQGSRSAPGLGQTVSNVGQTVGNSVTQTTQSVGGALGNNPVGNTVAGTGQTLGNTVTGLTGALGGALGGG